MKRKLLLLTALLLAVSLLLSGCQLWDLLVKHNYHFDDLEYTRPDVTALEITAGECVSKAPTEESLTVMVSLINDFLWRFADFYTQYELAYIHYCTDTSDLYWSREYQYCSGYTSAVEAARENLMYALADSPLREELEAERYFGEGYFSSYDGESMWSETFQTLLKQEAELVSRYHALSAPSQEHIPGTEAFYEACGPELESLFAELVLLRQQIAKEAGYSSYPEFAYSYYYRRDFTPENATALTNGIREELVPLYTSLADTGGWNVTVYATTDDLTFTYLRQTADNMGGVIEDAFSDMQRQGLYHIAYSDRKYPTSFETYLYSYNLPFVFVCPTKTTQDHLTFAHEFGHFCNDYASGGSVVSIDTAEVFSQAMEYLSLCYAEDTAELTAFKMADSLRIYVEQSAYAEFEHRVYSLSPPEVEPDTIRDLYAEIGRSYGFASWDFDARSYTLIPHIYIQPLYIISYVVSNDAAMQIYQKELDAPGTGLKVYTDSLTTEQEGFLSYLEEAGLESPFLPGRAGQIRETLETAIRQNAKDLPPEVMLAKGRVAKRCNTPLCFPKTAIKQTD